MACQARLGGLCPPGAPSSLRFSSVCLFPKIKNLYIPPEPIDHRIAEKSYVLFSCCFRSDLSGQASCHSSSSNNLEEDAWLMKIELKREEPVEAIKGDKS